MELDDVLGIVQRRTGPFSQQGSSFDLKFEELDFLSSVANHVSILEGICGYEPKHKTYFFEVEHQHGTISAICLYQSSMGFCEIIATDKRYSSNVLMQMFSTKIKKLYKKATGEPLEIKVNV